MSAGAWRERLFAHTTFNATAQRSPINCKVGANGRGINETNRRCLNPFDRRESRQRALVVFVLVLVEPQSTAETDGRRKFWLEGHVIPSRLLTRRNIVAACASLKL
jgi:hypothetical protein